MKEATSSIQKYSVNDRFQKEYWKASKNWMSTSMKDIEADDKFKAGEFNSEQNECVINLQHIYKK